MDEASDYSDPFDSASGATAREASRGSLEGVSSKNAPFAGGVFYIHDGRIYGWALNKDVLEQTVVVGVMCDGVLIEKAVADQHLKLPQSVAKPEGVDGHCFSIPVFPYQKRTAKGYRSKVVDVRVVGTSTYCARSLEVAAPHATMDGSRYEGYFDTSEIGVLRGWVWAPSQPDERLDVDIIIGDCWVARVAADRYRDDLRAAHVGAGEHSFRFRPGREVTGNTDASVVVALNGVRLYRESAKSLPTWWQAIERLARRLRGIGRS